LLRFNLEELGVKNRYLATSFACALICFFAFYKIDGKAAGLSLWTLFGATNQLIAGLALLTATAYLKQRQRPSWPLAIPAVFMVVMTMMGLSVKLQSFYQQQQWLLFTIAIALACIGIAVTFTTIAAVWRSKKN
jgi:carbon starvation protein